MAVSVPVLRGSGGSFAVSDELVAKIRDSIERNSELATAFQQTTLALAKANIKLILASGLSKIQADEITEDVEAQIEEIKDQLEGTL